MPVNRGTRSGDDRHPRRTHAERSAATRDALLSAARSVFAERGFGGAAREEICARAGVTRGALDHHFDGKAGLFRAVVEDVEAGLTDRIMDVAMKAPDPLAMLRAGCHAYVEAATEPEVRQIVLLDGRAVLGWEDWQEIQANHGYGITAAAVQAAMDRGQIVTRPLEPMTHMLLAALTEAAMYVATSDAPKKARQEARLEIDRLLDGFVRGPSSVE